MANRSYLKNWYNRDGSPATEDTFKAWRSSEKKVAETILPTGHVVSTVWLGLDHRFGPEGPPLIFETMVFPSKGDYEDLDMERYSTEAEAHAGHARMVAKWLAIVAAKGD